MNDSLGDCGFYCAGAAVSCRPPRPAFAAGWLQWRRECELQQAGCLRHRECKSRWPVMDGERRGFDAVGAGSVPFDGAERAVRMGIFAMICVCAQRRECELQQVGFAR